MLQIHLHLQATLVTKTNGRVLGTFQNAMLFRKSAALERKVLSISLYRVKLFPQKTETINPENGTTQWLKQGVGI